MQASLCWSLAAGGLLVGAPALANPQPTDSPGAHVLIVETGIPVERHRTSTLPPQPPPPPAEQAAPEHPNPSVQSQPEAAPQPQPSPAPNPTILAPAPPEPQPQRIEAAPERKLAPGGTTIGSSSAKENDTPDGVVKPISPTPRGFPLGAPGGSYAPAGPSPSGPNPGFKMDAPPRPTGE